MLRLDGLREAACVLLAVVGVTSAVAAQAPRIRDSAGVRIVENPSRRAAPVIFQISADTVLDVGERVAKPEDHFHPGQGYLRAAVLSDGSLSVIDVDRVHLFDARGGNDRIVGRPGSGPTEFLYNMAICRSCSGDTVIVEDSHNARVAILKDTVVVRTSVPSMAAADHTPGNSSVVPFDFCFDDGTFVVQTSHMPPQVNGSTLLTRYHLDGSVANVIGQLPARPFDLVSQAEPVVVASGQRLYYGNANRSEIQVLTPDGKLVALIRSDDPPIAISDSEADRRLASTIPSASADDRAERIAAMRAAQVTTWPAYGRVHVAPDGQLWVEDYRNDHPSADGWTAFDASGRLIGRLVIPAAATGERQPEVIGFGVNSIILRPNVRNRPDRLVVVALNRVDSRP